MTPTADAEGRRERYCSLCGLPIARTFTFTGDTGQDASDEEAAYCCSGCRTVADVESAGAETGSSARGMIRIGLGVFFTMNVMVFSMALWSENLYAAGDFETPLAETLRGLFRWGSLLFAAPVLLLLGGPIAVGVWQALRRGEITTDLLILFGVAASYAYSVASVLRGSGDVYCEVGSMVLLFVSIGRWMEAKGKVRASQSLDALASLLPETVRIRNTQGNYEERPRGEAKAGDAVRVLPGERLPVDGTVLSGEAQVDQQVVTGESRLVEKQPGDAVYSGTLNTDGDLRVRVTAGDGQETVSRMLAMVCEARLAKGRHQQIADRVAAWFVPVVCVVALLAGWRQSAGGEWQDGILTALSVVVIACPCALGLATPLTIWTALGRAAPAGVLFRSGAVIEKLAAVRTACFDKTGTLTTGLPTVSRVHVFGEDRSEEVFAAAAVLSAGSTHPVSRAVAELVGATGSAAASEFGESPVKTIAGRGLEADIEGLGRALLGSRKLIEERGLEPPAIAAAHEDSANRLHWLALDGQVLAAFETSESLRPEAAAALDRCRELGLQLQMLSGDESASVQAVAEQVDLRSAGDQLPEDKLEAVRRLAGSGAVAMVGDGLNDAPALAAADVGVALGCGADLSRDAAGVCLLSDDLARFPWAVELARRTVRTVKQNLFWAFAYNCIGVGLAASGRLNPVWAAAAMVVSSLLVVGNSLRLSTFPDCHSSADQADGKAVPGMEWNSDKPSPSAAPLAEATA
ncbi:MAG: cation-translocating P-type ATPase [Planctomycetota bacterium]